MDEDRDGDGVMDSQEILDGTDPLNSCSFKLSSQTATPSTAWQSADCDNDGLTNQQEKTLGTDPVKGDSDGDAVLDGKEVSDGTSPLDSCSFKLSSQTATPSSAWQSADCDNDGLTNQQEKTLGTDPLKGDSDGDGVPEVVSLIKKSNEGWSVMFPLYGPIESWFDQTWKPGKIELVEQM